MRGTSLSDTDAVAALRHQQHGRMPSSSTYALLKTATGAQRTWDAERAEARRALGARDRGGLVDALLADGDVDDAWGLATGDDWSPDVWQ
jgi:hypothetical protein